MSKPMNFAELYKRTLRDGLNFHSMSKDDLEGYILKERLKDLVYDDVVFLKNKFGGNLKDILKKKIKREQLSLTLHDFKHYNL